MKKKTRILFTLMGLEIGGAETHVVELARYLSKNGFLVYVVSNGGVYEKELEKCGIKHIYAPLTSKNPKKMLSAYKIIKKAVIENKIDLIHSHARIPAFISSLVHKRLGVPFMTTVHGVYSTDLIFKLLTNWGQKTICVSDDIQKYVIENYNVEKENTFITINGIDTSKFSENTNCDDLYSEFGITSNDFKIVYVSRLDEGNCEMAYKLINISKRLKNKIPNAIIIMVGDGDKYDEIDSLIKTNGIENIILAGRRIDVEKFTAISDLFIGISRAALEAMSAKNIVLLGGDPGYMGIFNENILGECFLNNFTCRNTSKLDENKLLDDIIKVYNLNDSEKTKLKDFGQKLIYEKYSVKTMADDNINVYKKLLNETNYSYDFVISGYYGFNNSGDDALLMAMVESLKSHDENIKILVLSKNPHQTAKQYNVDSVNRFNVFKIGNILKRTKIFISGGGSLIQDVTSTKSILYYLSLIKFAIKKKTNVYVYANGVGPINRERNRNLTKKTLEKVKLITLREDDSKKLISEIGINNTPTIITADPAFDLKLPQENEISNILALEGIDLNKRLVGVSVRDWKHSTKNFAYELAQKIDSICKKHNLTPLFLPMQYPNDYEFSKKVMSYLDVDSFIIKNQYSGEVFSGIIKKCEFTIAMRLHASIYSISVGVPVIGIVYDPKVESILKYAKLPYFVDVNNLCSNEFENVFENLYKNREEIQKNLDISVKELKEKSEQNSLYAIKLLNCEEIK